MCAAGRTAFAASLLLSLCAFAGSPAWGAGRHGPEQANQQPATPGQVTRRVGTIKAISGSAITLAPDTGAEIDIALQDSTKVVRIPPGETNLKNATPAQLQDLQVGDRIYAAGKLADDGKTINALTVVLMKQSDVAAKQAHDREDWQKRGMSGEVSAVDLAGGTITISQPSLTGNKAVTVHITKSTIVRRYAPDSFPKFEDAKPSTLGLIKSGDQVDALGTRSADGTELEAEVIVSGGFRNFVGTVVSADATANTVTVLDLANNKPVLVKVTTDSQLHKLPEQMAQRIAMRLKGGAAGAPGAQGGSPNAGAQAASAAQPTSGGLADRPRGNGSPNLQQMVARSPSITVTDLHKGDAVKILSTEGTASGGVTAITLVAGIEAILQASPKGSQGMILSPWSLGGNGGEAESQ